MRYLLVLFLCGCASSWHHATKTDQEFHQDAFDCMRIARSSIPFEGGLSGDLQRKSFGDACLRARGWEAE